MISGGVPFKIGLNRKYRAWSKLLKLKVLSFQYTINMMRNGVESIGGLG